MQKILIGLAVMAILAGQAQAAQLVAEWLPQTTLAIDGTRIYQNSSASGPVASVPGNTINTVTFTVTDDGRCHNFWAVNYNSVGESPRSEVVLWCPPSVDPPPAGQPPATVGGFKIVTTVEPIR
jgi:hypothetical protein